MKRLLTIIAAALMLAVQVQAAEVACTHLGTVATYEPLTPGPVLRWPSAVLSPAINVRSAGVSEGTGGGIVGANLSVPQRSTVMTYYRCALPGGGSLGAGTVRWNHGGSAAPLRSSPASANQAEFALVDIGAGLDAADNASAGTVVGASAAWPTGVRGAPMSASVDFGGASVGDTFDIRVSSKVRGGNVQVWHANFDNVSLDVAVSAAAVSETDALIAQLATVLGIDAGTLRHILSLLAVPQ